MGKLDRSLDDGAGWDVDPEPIAKQGRIERGEVRWRPADVQAVFEELRLSLQNLPQTMSRDALGNQRDDRWNAICLSRELCIDDRAHGGKPPSLGSLGRKALHAKRFGSAPAKRA